MESEEGEEVDGRVEEVVRLPFQKKLPRRLKIFKKFSIMRGDEEKTECQYDKRG